MPAIRLTLAAVAAAFSLVAFATPAFATPGTVKGGTNVFAQPDAGSTAIGSLNNAQSIDISGCNSNWCQVSGGGVSGWIPKNTVTFKGLLKPRVLSDGPVAQPQPQPPRPQPEPPRPPRPGNNNNNSGPGFSFDFNFGNGDFGNGNPGPFPPQRPRPPRPQPPQQSEACFYSSTNFRGDSFCVGRGESYDYLPNDWDDSIRSVEIFGRAQVDLCRDEDMEGACVTLRSSQSRLPNQLDRRASSLEVY